MSETISAIASPNLDAGASHHYRLHHDPHSSHQQILSLVRSLNRPPMLDVGAAQGMLGQLLQGSGLEIDAIEPNPAWAESARPFYRNTFVGTAESVSPPRRHYRTVVCADVLEHTVNPVGVVKRLRELATDDATFIISVPNVAHLAVRMMLLAGHFPKHERGILDRTHLHFFTRRTATDTLRDAGLRIVRRSATGLPLEEIWKSGKPSFLFRTARNVQWLAVQLMPQLCAFQWILVARAPGFA